jgi:hypothetical protein
MTRKPTEAVEGAHVVVTDTWVRSVRHIPFHVAVFVFHNHPRTK